eukprot:jgi/Psemu1/32850/gm1.32850_g
MSKLTNSTKMEKKPESAYKRTILPPRFPFESVEYTKRMKELNHKDLNNNLNQFLYHFKTGFDTLCAQNGHLVLRILKGCKKIKYVRTRLNSNKGHFNEDEALEIWEECFKYVTEELFPSYEEEGNTDNIDHVWAMGIILLYLSCGYPALKGTEDIKCYNNVGIGPEV